MCRRPRKASPEGLLVDHLSSHHKGLKGVPVSCQLDSQQNRIPLMTPGVTEAILSRAKVLISVVKLWQFIDLAAHSSTASTTLG